jgi:hypothetical protein
MGWRLRKRQRQGLVRAAPGGGGWRVFVRKKTKGQCGKVTPLQLRQLGKQYRTLPAAEKAVFLSEGVDATLAHRHSVARIADAPPTLAVVMHADQSLVALSVASRAQALCERSALTEASQATAKRLHAWALDQQGQLGELASPWLPQGSVGRNNHMFVSFV